MSDTVVYQQLDQDPHAAEAGSASPTPEAGRAGADADLRRLSEVPLELTVEIGRTRMTVGDTLQLRPGSIVTLERLAGEPVDLLVNGTPIARGEVVVVDEQFGLRVTEVLEGDRAEPGAGGPVLRADSFTSGREEEKEEEEEGKEKREERTGVDGSGPYGQAGGEPLDSDPSLLQ
jgi:flagellar motor switch protein FliN/FliY